MRIHFIQHVPFEGPANIGKWAKNRGFDISVTHLYAGQSLPDIKDIDMAAVMGGPMNIYEYTEYPWLKHEKLWLKQAIDADRAVIGICLGAQLIAHVLGAQIKQNNNTEIGWFKVELSDMGRKDSLLSKLPKSFTAFHWHGDTFTIPPGSVHLASSDACMNQAFQYGRRALGMQFHLDYNQDSINAMLKNCVNELVTGDFIQTEDNIHNSQSYVEQLEKLLFTVLDEIVPSVR
jgi:GMP synthase (glutamine-hydrolysing)